MTPRSEPLTQDRLFAAVRYLATEFLFPDESGRWGLPVTVVAPHRGCDPLDDACGHITEAENAMLDIEETLTAARGRHLTDAEIARSEVPASDLAALDWPTLANVIREVDGNHDLGAGELAERILAHPKVRAALRSRPVAEPQATLHSDTPTTSETGEPLHPAPVSGEGPEHDLRAAHPRPEFIAALTRALRVHGSYIVGGAWHSNRTEELAGLIDAALYNAGFRPAPVSGGEPEPEAQCHQHGGWHHHGGFGHTVPYQPFETSDEHRRRTPRHPAADHTHAAPSQPETRAGVEG